MSSAFDFSRFDRPEVLGLIFYPRPDYDFRPDGAADLKIPVTEGVIIGGRFFAAGKSAPTILFFHGNGEIVSDYDDIGPLYVKMNINFMPVDYRGYGASSGRPSVSAMMNDSHEVFTFARDYLAREGYGGPLIVMGRSLGSAPALELVSAYAQFIDGLIIESGFARLLPLLEQMGLDSAVMGLSEEGFNHTGKISGYRGPTLVIHSEFDHIIPFADGEELFKVSGAPEKSFLKINDANHNTILAEGLQQYMAAVKKLTQTVVSGGKSAR